MQVRHSYKYFIILLLSFAGVSSVKAQSDLFDRWGSNDTVVVAAIIYEGVRMPYKELPNVYVSNMDEKQLASYLQKYNRLRNAVYVTYPYARTAGATLNDVHSQLNNIKSKSDRKAYIKTREKELKAQFSDPLSNLSVYQGKVLMKLINRQTGNNCYEIVKEFKGGVNARLYQTVAFFFGSTLKQPYDLNDETDRMIETIVKEIDIRWYHQPQPLVMSSQ